MARLTTLVLCLILLLVLNSCVVSGLNWTPQLGTIKHPKNPTFSLSARGGDVFRINSKYYRANTDIESTEHAALASNLPIEGQENQFWRSLERGTYLLPKILGVDFECASGDIFKDPEDDAYYRSRGNGRIDDNWGPEISDKVQGDCRLEWVDDTANWMTLLRPEIGDTRLGDLVLPGCHDAGTAGITEDSILVDQNFLFQLAQDVTPATVVNWSITQPDEFDAMLQAGFRSFDMRIADVDEFEPGVFRWWHGLAADNIIIGLQHVAQFSIDHPEEVLILDMNTFAAPGNASDPTLPIPQDRNDVLSDLLLQYLETYMTPRGTLPANPTINQVLATGHNIIMVMQDSYIRAKDDRYWDDVIHNAWSGATNPEELFNKRSETLMDFRQNYADSMTDLSGCITPNEQIVIAGLFNVYGDNETLMDIINETFPIFSKVDPSDMSYEGLWMDLMSMAHYGTNTDGMWVRPEELYSNGASVHYNGNNAMLRYWVARPDLYKPNVVATDDFEISTFVQTAISANAGEIPREVSIVHQGNTMSGYYTWNHDFATNGGEEGVNCEAVDVQYTVTDQSIVLDTGVFQKMGLLDIQDGQYPPTARCQLDVRSTDSGWFELITVDIANMFNNTLDLYIRGTDVGSANGFAYASSAYDDFGWNCTIPPILSNDILAFVDW